jgi:hypothetical protein
MGKNLLEIKVFFKKNRLTPIYGDVKIAWLLFTVEIRQNTA